MGAAIYQKLLSISAILILLMLTACSGVPNFAAVVTPTDQVAVSSEFRDLYQSLGNAAELGVAISAPFNQNGLLCQYTVYVLMCFNPAAHSEADRLFLAPLGQQFHFPTTDPKSAGPLKIFEGFAETYHKKFFGVRFVGQPLTGVRYNAEARRLEQFFEKMGFYMEVDDPQHIVHLLPYGTALCREECRASLQKAQTSIGWTKGIEVLNPASLDRLGGYGLYGDPLTIPYLAADGSLEQVLDKVVVYVPVNNPTTLRLRSLATLLNLPYQDPHRQVYGRSQNVVFYITNGELGYHVPIMFDAFIAQHGGMEISGKPLSDPYPVEAGGQQIARQCFENYCLEYTPSAPENQRVQLVSLGQLFMKTLKRDDLQTFKFSNKTVALTAAEQKPQISSLEAQIIQIQVRTRKDKLPISEVESFVTLGLPDNRKLSFDLPPTNASGLAQVSIPPINNTANGTIVPYIVCLNVPTEDPNDHICAYESFLIWNLR